MDECIVFDTEKEAREQFNYDVIHDREFIISFNPFHKTILYDTYITHWYMGTDRYKNWCKGMLYTMDGLMYYDGLLIQK